MRPALREQLERTQNELQERRREADVALARRDRLQAELVEFQGAVEQRRTTLQATEEALVTTQRKLLEAQASLTTLQGRVATREAALRDAEGALAKVQEERAQVRKDADRLGLEVQSLTQARAQLDAQRTALQNEIATLTARSAEESKLLDDVLDALETAERQTREAKREAEAADRLLAGRNAQVQAAEREVQRLTKEVEGHRQETTRLTNEILTSNRQLAQVEAQRVAAEKELASLREKRAAEEKRWDELALALRNAERKLQDVLREGEAATKQLATWKNEFVNADANLKKVTQDLETRRGDLRQVLTQQADAAAKVQSLQTQEKTLSDSVATLKLAYEKSIEALRQSGHADDAAEAELWAKVFDRRPSDTKARNELEALQAVQDRLRSNGLVFSERTINAFHTSLKTADMSPLVVLAGISGTGKSELPRRYAEAMGMHFLGVPVQPRWDSPQDMFGFFNYLERRFRPTELTRALIQFDAIKDRKGRGWKKPSTWTDSIADQMLVVLLDEMNLARVEYYFSDLLSKLETRRGVDPKNDDQRTKAEVVLEVGHRGKDEASAMRLFVDTNVLFCGTMNEDESTQTLSDKVVDRANVLRFGRPRHLQGRAQDGAVDRTGTAGRGLGHSVWKSWLRKDADLVRRPELNEQLDRWIDKLNEAMGQIGRPFAHRTNQAIRAYVANYPVETDEGARWAVSDQIEQRILPKLRGLDPADPQVTRALEAVRGVVRDLEDPDLQTSIDQGKSGHQFHWQGVDRVPDAATT